MKKFKIFTQVTYKAELLQKQMEDFVNKKGIKVEGIDININGGSLVSLVTYTECKPVAEKKTKN